MSSTMARSILRTLSACRSSLEENGIALNFVTPATTLRHLCPEHFVDPLDGRERILDDVVEQPGRNFPTTIEMHVDQQGRQLQGGESGRAHRNVSPGLCARRPRTRRPVAGSSMLASGFVRRTFSTRSSNRIMTSGV